MSFQEYARVTFVYIIEYNEKTMYMAMSRDQHAGQNHDMTIDKLFESEEQFRYLGTILTNQNSVHKEIKSRLMAGNAGYHSVPNLVPLFVYGYEAWSPTLEKKHRLRVFQKRGLREIFRPKKNEVTGE
jgi:hypothetical protein